VQNELSSVVDALPAMVWSALPDGRVDFVNRRWCGYVGQAADAAWGDGWQTWIHPDDFPGLLDCWRSILASGAAGEMEARLRRIDGEYRWFVFQVSPRIDASGQVAKWWGINTDIDVRKRAEEAVRAREGRFRSIIEGLPVLVTLHTPAGDVELVNRRVVEYFGATLEEMKGRPGADIYHPDDRPKLIAAWSASIDAGHPYEFEARLRRADGVYRWFQLRAFPLRDAAGQIVLWYLLQIDIDDWKRAEALLAGEKRLLEMVANGDSMSEVLEELCELVESTASGCYCSVVLVDPTGTHLEHGVAPSLPASFITSIVGRPVSMHSGPCGMAAYLNERVVSPDIASEMRWSSHEWCQMALAHGLRACSSTPISSAAGKVLGAFAIYYNEPTTPSTRHQELVEQFTHIASIAIERVQRDAERRLSEEVLGKVRSELARVARVTSLGALTASIAHEVNQPLSGILTNASTCLRMLGADPPNVDGARETARRTIRDGNRASEVVTRLRALFGKKDATTEAMDLNEATREVIALTLSELKRGRVILREELADDLPPVTGDRIQLQQVILNLLLNASDAMSGVEDRPRHLVVKTHREGGDRVRVAVEDVGVGFEPQVADRLFEAFYTTKSGGMGIGLSVSRSIIESHQGRLSAAPNDGPGAIFSFSIPVASDRASGAYGRDAIREAVGPTGEPARGNS